MPRDDEPDDPFARARSRRRLVVRGFLGVAGLVTVSTLGLGGLRASAMRTSTRLAIEEARIQPNPNGYLRRPHTLDGERYTGDQALRETLLDTRNPFVVTRPYWAIVGDCAEVDVSDRDRMTRIFLRLERKSALDFEVRDAASKGDCD